MANAAVEEIERHRAEITGHCYRMLGSVVDAEDVVQETMVRAWRGLESFDGRSSLRTWLYRIATNACLDALGDRARRVRSTDEWPAGTIDDDLETRPRSHWLEPVPDARVIPTDADPATRAMLRQSIRLAFVAALQHLPPKQRAALLLTEVLGFSAAEAAATLETTVASVNSALQRSRSTLAALRAEDAAAELDANQARVVDRYVAAFESYDVDTLTTLLRDDVTMSMPPYTLWLRGPDTVRAWLLGRGATCRGSRLVPTSACGCPAFVQYHPAEGRHRAWSIHVLELSGERVTGMTFFLDVEALFPAFGAPLELPT